MPSRKEIQDEQNELWSVQGDTLCSDSAKCCTMDSASQEHTAKETQEFLKSEKRDVLQWTIQSPDLNSIEHTFHLLKTKMKAKRPTNKQELKVTAVKSWQRISREETHWWSSEAKLKKKKKCHCPKNSDLIIYTFTTTDKKKFITANLSGTHRSAFVYIPTARNVA